MPVPGTVPGRRAVLLGLAASAGSAARPHATAEAAPAPLAAFHAALRRASATPVHVLQFGDSHTANDSFSGRLRELFQGRFGDAGRGLLPPGVPHDWYRPSGLRVSTAGWQPFPGPGLAPLRQYAAGSATMELRAEAPGAFALLAVDSVPRQGGGTLDILPDAGPAQSVATAGQGRALLRCPAATTVTLRARGDGPVDLLGVTLLTGRPGVTWSNLGLPGATVSLTERWGPEAAAQAGALGPALLVLAFGTNEGFKDATDLAAYRPLFAARLRALRDLAPAASILVLLPPDGLRRGAPGCPDGWGVPPLLPAIRQVQADAARAAGAAAWDWQAATGGACSILPLMRTDPPAAAPDGVHLFRPGYRLTAERLFAFLTAGLA